MMKSIFMFYIEFHTIILFLNAIYFLQVIAERKAVRQLIIKSSGQPTQNNTDNLG